MNVKKWKNLVDVKNVGQQRLGQRQCGVEPVPEERRLESVPVRVAFGRFAVSFEVAFPQWFRTVAKRVAFRIGKRCGAGSDEKEAQDFSGVG